jgi:hemerythrin
MFFQWEPEFEINVKDIDEQHRYMVALINDFYEALRSGRGKEVLGRVLKDLSEYAKNHFDCEERLMTESGYPGYAAHKAEHAELAGKVRELDEDYRNSGRALAVKVGVFLREWLMKHVLASDLEFGRYLNAAASTVSGRDDDVKDGGKVQGRE